MELIGLINLLHSQSLPSIYGLHNSKVHEFRVERDRDLTLDKAVKFEGKRTAGL